ncbi:hypothetical protein [Streptomyces mesophilus]|uniref:hypothetical protein n=1 Tax=Streptomyces mesophilus TaxID=1775132 RepID=UPI003329F100
MMPDESKIPVGPPGTNGTILTPGQLKIGDLIRFDGIFFPVRDMVTGQGGAKVLIFADREPYTVAGPTLAYRPIDFNALAGTLRYIRTE